MKTPITKALSLRTQSIIGKIKQTINQADKDGDESLIKEKVNAILKGPSAREKFEDLTHPQRELVLPIKLKRLCKIAAALDSTISFFKLRNKIKCYYYLVN